MTDSIYCYEVCYMGQEDEQVVEVTGTRMEQDGDIIRIYDNAGLVFAARNWTSVKRSYAPGH